MKKAKDKLHIRETRKCFVTMYGNGSGCHILIPKTLIGEEVEVSFYRKLTEEEIKRMELSQLRRELEVIRRKRMKK